MSAHFETSTEYNRKNECKETPENHAPTCASYTQNPDISNNNKSSQ